MYNPHYHTDLDARMVRAMNILQSNCISRREDDSFVVPSLTRRDVVYEVRLIGERFACTCPDLNAGLVLKKDNRVKNPKKLISILSKPSLLGMDILTNYVIRFNNFTAILER